MSIAYQDDFVTLHTGTALDVLREMPERSVHMCVTSPPYWGLRSYLPQDHPAKGQEIGTERSPDEFVAKLVEVFGEVWRVLRDDGQLWVNISDTYSSRGGAGGTMSASGLVGGSKRQQPRPEAENPAEFGRWNRQWGNLKPKDLCMIPARLAIALQSWGWYLRQELVWAKDSCMPESVRDRCTRSHEFVYMLSKKPRYFYDSIAIAEPTVSTHGSGNGFKRPQQLSRDGRGSDETWEPIEGGTRNARSVWRINPRAYGGGHFAVFPPELPQRCIKAGTSERGVCSECGASWRRVVEATGNMLQQQNGPGTAKRHLEASGPHGSTSSLTTGYMREMASVGWEPTCSHEADTIPATVLDPFAGSGTTLYAARSLGRKSVGIDLDEKSAELLQARLGHQGVLL